MCFEIISRRYQLWEELYASSLRESEAGGGTGAWLDERDIFLGQRRTRGRSLVCPLLESWVASKLQEEAAVLKERRKGREEKLLARGVDPTGAATEHAEGGGGDGHPGGKKRGGGRGRGGK